MSSPSTRISLPRRVFPSTHHRARRSASGRRSSSASSHSWPSCRRSPTRTTPPDTKPSAALAAQAPTKADTPTARLNTPVRDGKFEFVVKTVQPGLAEIGDNPYLREKAQGQFVIVTLSVQNIGDRAQGFSPSNQKLIDTQGRSFESDSSAQIALGDSDIPVWDDINPGNAVDVSLVYDMPVGAAPARIELHDSMFSGGVTVELTP
ncbi:DUF4352 domain-containing protein [Mycolicibacterium fortuitum]